VFTVFIYAQQYLACSGYMAPEYVMHGEFSVKSDVFSFGVLVLEIISGQKNISIHHGENKEDRLSFVSLPLLIIVCYELNYFDT